MYLILVTPALPLLGFQLSPWTLEDLVFMLLVLSDKVAEHITKSFYGK